jgi:hypothetical protein
MVRDRSAGMMSEPITPDEIAGIAPHFTGDKTTEEFMDWQRERCEGPGPHLTYCVCPNGALFHRPLDDPDGWFFAGCHEDWPCAGIRIENVDKLIEAAGQAARATAPVVREWAERLRATVTQARETKQ